jgi:hypothetical protein
MRNPSGQDNSAAPGQADHGGERDKAEAEYYAKQAKDISESRECVWAQTEIAHTMDSIKEERQKDANEKTDGKDCDYYNGLGQ